MPRSAIFRRFARPQPRLHLLQRLYPLIRSLDTGFPLARLHSPSLDVHVTLQIHGSRQTVLVLRAQKLAARLAAIDGPRSGWVTRSLSGFLTLGSSLVLNFRCGKVVVCPF